MLGVFRCTPIRPLIDTIHMALASFVQQAQEQNISITCAVPEDIVLYHDKNGCQALGNIIKNSLEHSTSGGFIELRAIQTPLTVQLTVKTTAAASMRTKFPTSLSGFTVPATRKTPLTAWASAFLWRGRSSNKTMGISMYKAP